MFTVDVKNNYAMQHVRNEGRLFLSGVAKVRKEASFRERKVPFAKGKFWLRKEDIYEK